MAESIVRKRVPPAGMGTKVTKEVPDDLSPVKSNIIREPIPPSGTSKGPEAPKSLSNTVTGNMPSKTVKTKGGTYPVYAKGTKEATSFDNAFGQARKDGLKSFMWQGQKYNTKKK